MKLPSIFCLHLLQLAYTLMLLHHFRFPVLPLNPMALYGKNIYQIQCQFSLPVAFTHRWLHHCLVTKELITYPTYLLCLPFPWFLERFLFVTLSLISLIVFSYYHNHNVSICNDSIEINSIRKKKYKFKEWGNQTQIWKPMNWPRGDWALVKQQNSHLQ